MHLYSVRVELSTCWDVGKVRLRFCETGTSGSWSQNRFSIKIKVSDFDNSPDAVFVAGRTPVNREGLGH